MTGRIVENDTFEDFVYRYLTLGFSHLDTHVLPQRQHLWPVEYSDAIAIKTLHDTMKDIFDSRIVDKYFLQPVNKTPQSYLPNSDLSQTPLHELRELYNERKGLPTNASLITKKIRAKLEELYFEDFVFVEY